MNKLIPIERIESKIYLIRGQKVMLSHDLADLYKVKTFVFNQAVRRNINRFPDDFMFGLTMEEFRSLRSQLVILDKRPGRGRHSKYPPLAFTEQGIAMLSSVLNSEQAIMVNIAIIRAFVRLRQMISSHKELAHKIGELEKKYSKHEIEITTVFKLLKKLMEPPPASAKPAKRIGFLRS